MRISLKEIGNTIMEMAIETNTTTVVGVVNNLSDNKIPEEFILDLEDVVLQLKEWNDNH